LWSAELGEKVNFFPEVVGCQISTMM